MKNSDQWKQAFMILRMKYQNARTEGMREGISLGERAGIKIGERKARMEMSQALLSSGSPPSFVSGITGIPMSVITELVIKG